MYLLQMLGSPDVKKFGEFNFGVDLKILGCPATRKPTRLSCMQALGLSSNWTLSQLRYQCFRTNDRCDQSRSTPYALKHYTVPQ